MRKIVVILVLIQAILLSSCENIDAFLSDALGLPTGEPEVLAEHIEEVAERPAFPIRGGTVTLSARQPQTLNPLLNTCRETDMILALIFDALFILDADRKPMPNPVLVRSADYNFEDRSVTLTLNYGLLWSDGTAFTADDVAFTINFLRNEAPANAIHRGTAAAITGVAVLDENSIRINLGNFSGHMGYSLLLPIVPAHYYRNIAASHSRQMNPVGSGPFALSAFSMGRGMTFSANDNSSRTPFFDSVDVRFLAGAEAAISALNNGVADAGYLFGPDYRRILNVGANIEIREFPSHRFDFLAFNFREELPALHEFRQAVSHLIPFNDLSAAVYAGEGVVALTPVPPASWLYYEDLIQPEFSFEAAIGIVMESESLRLRVRPSLYASWAVPGVTVWEGTDDESAEPIRILAFSGITGASERIRIANILAENLALIGFPATVISPDWSEDSQLLFSGEFDIFIGGYNLSVNPCLNFMLNSSTGELSGIINYRSAELDSLLDAARNTGSDAEAIEAFADLQRYLARELPIVGLAFRTSALVVNNRVGGVSELAVNNYFHNIEEWYFWN